MVGLGTMLREGGWAAYLALLLGIVGALVGMCALLALAFSRRVAFHVGLGALALATLTGSVGLLGTMRGRSTTDAALKGGGGVSAIMQDRIRQQGYEEAESAAKVGLDAALVPLLLGAVAAAMGAVAKPLSTGRWLAFGLGAFVTLAVTGASYAASNAPLPKGKYGFMPDDVEAWTLAEAREDIDTDQLAGCDALHDALMPLWGPPDPHQWPRQFRRDPDTRLLIVLPAGRSSPAREQVVPGSRDAATAYVRVIWPAVQAKGTTARPMATYHAPAKVWTQEALLASPLLVDDALHTEIAAYKPPPPETIARSSTKLRRGSATVNGQLPPEVIQRIVRQQNTNFRRCYDEALKTNPTLQGRVTTKFIIDASGNVTSVSDGGSDLPDASVRSCVQDRFKTLTFPEPEGGIVTVVYPLIFSRAD